MSAKLQTPDAGVIAAGVSRLGMRKDVWSASGGGATVLEIFTLKDRKVLILPTPPSFDAPTRGNPLEFRDETYPTKTRGMWLPYGENFIILTSTVFL